MAVEEPSQDCSSAVHGSCASEALAGLENAFAFVRVGIAEEHPSGCLTRLAAEGSSEEVDVLLSLERL